MAWWRTQQAESGSRIGAVINIAEDFSPVPIGRHLADGDHSGEAFREELLKPRFSEAVKNNRQLKIDFDGMRGLSASFLEEAFGGLVRTSDYSADQVLETLLFAPEDRFEVFIDAIREYIRNADKQ